MHNNHIYQIYCVDNLQYMIYDLLAVSEQAKSKPEGSKSCVFLLYHVYWK